MSSRSLFHLYDRILDGELGPMLLSWRSEGASHMEIAMRLRGVGVDVSTEWVRRWVTILEDQAKAS